MDRLDAMSTFLTVVEQGSLSAAARRLKTPLTTVSRKVSELEFSPADEALQAIEPAAGANGCRHFLPCGLQAHSR